MNTINFDTKYGLITLYNHDKWICNHFKINKYWEEKTMLKLKEYINPELNILEIGGHCGTSSIVYSSFLAKTSKVYVYEPQKNMYNLLVKNINQNNLHEKIIPYHKGVFCYNGIGNMNDTDVQEKSDLKVLDCYEDNTLCNFGGIGLGENGENVELTTIDSMDIENIGFIHCDAQGAENFIFSKGIDLITKYRPVIFYEDNESYEKELYNNVCKTYPQYTEESKFNIKKFCLETLNYTEFKSRFNWGNDNLLIP